MTKMVFVYACLPSVRVYVVVSPVRVPFILSALKVSKCGGHARVDPGV